MATKLKKPKSQCFWNTTVVDKEPNHYYQPGFLFIAFGSIRKYGSKPKKKFIPKGVDC
jgi:sulfide:quinone oxidoreductase